MAATADGAVSATSTLMGVFFVYDAQLQNFIIKLSSDLERQVYIKYILQP